MLALIAVLVHGQDVIALLSQDLKQGSSGEEL